MCIFPRIDSLNFQCAQLNFGSSGDCVIEIFDIHFLIPGGWMCSHSQWVGVFLFLVGVFSFLVVGYVLIPGRCVLIPGEWVCSRSW